MERSNSSILLLCDPDNLWRAVSAFLLCSNPGVGVHFNYKIHVINAILPLCSCPSGSFVSFHVSLCFWAGVKVVRGVVVGYHGKQSGQRKNGCYFLYCCGFAHWILREVAFVADRVDSTLFQVFKGCIQHAALRPSHQVSQETPWISACQAPSCLCPKGPAVRRRGNASLALFRSLWRAIAEANATL